MALDEVAELPLAMQGKLLRAIQERRVRKVGSTSEDPVDVRILSATHQDLAKLVTAGRFRQDLYYRLNVFPIHIPPLRERKTDILQLADFFVEKYGTSSKKQVRRISTPAIDMLMSYTGPGTCASWRTSSSARSSCTPAPRRSRSTPMTRCIAARNTTWCGWPGPSAGTSAGWSASTSSRCSRR